MATEYVEEKDLGSLYSTALGFYEKDRNSYLEELISLLYTYKKPRPCTDT